MMLMGATMPQEKLDKFAIADDTYQIETIAHEKFDDATWKERWAVEGNAVVSVADGKLFIRRKDVAGSQVSVATVWYRADLPANALVTFRARAIEPADQNAANFNIILHAREADGSELRFGRSGKYDEYHKIPNYIVTFVGGAGAGWSRVRRDPGFEMLHEVDIRSEIGREYEIVATIVDGRIRWYLDGKKIHDVRDPSPLAGGKFAIRTWSTDGWWDDVTIARIVRE